MESTHSSVHIMHPDHVVATGLQGILADHGEFRVTRHEQEPEAAQAAHLIIADHATGTALARQRERGAGRAFVLVVTPLDREAEVRAALDSGVHGYVLLSAGSEEIHEAVRATSQGQRYLSVPVMHKIADSFTREPLTGRENDVLHLLAEGCCNKLIARRLNIGVGTVKTHVKSLMLKLEVHARTQAVVVATERGLVGPRLYRNEARHWSLGGAVGGAA